MALSGFLVPFASGALIKRQEIADEYDDTAGEIIDAASAKYNEKLSLNNKTIDFGPITGEKLVEDVEFNFNNFTEILSP